MFYKHVSFFIPDEIDEPDEIPDELLLSTSPFPTPLLVFASVGGLALLAEHLPLLFPEISRQITLADNSSETTVGMADTSQDWVTVDSYPEDFYDVRILYGYTGHEKFTNNNFIISCSFQHYSGLEHSIKKREGKNTSLNKKKITRRYYIIAYYHKLMTSPVLLAYGLLRIKMFQAHVK